MQSPTRLPCTLAALLFPLAISCGSSETDILLTLSNLPSNATSVAVSATIDNRPLTGMPNTTAVSALLQGQLALKLPATGRVSLNIQALDSDGCTRAEATAAVDVPTGLSSLSAPLTAVSPRRCGNLPGCAAGTACLVSPSLTTNDIQSIWSITPTNIWAVGNATTILHFDGTKWTATPSGNLPVPATTNFYGVWASSATDVWAVGTAGRIIHYDGTTWTLSSNGATNTLFGISGLSGQDIYTVGAAASTTSAGEFWHYNGTVWSQIAPVVKGTLGAVWAVSPNFVVAGGGPAMGTGTLIGWDGTKITDYSTAVTNFKLHGIWGSDRTHVFAVGDTGTVFRFDGSSWKLLDTPFFNQLFGVSGDSSSLYAVGASGIIARNTDQTFSGLAVAASSGSGTLWTVNVPASGNGIVWLGGAGGYLGYLDSRP